MKIRRASERESERAGEFARSPAHPLARSGRRREAGQATTELALILPILVMLAGGAMFLVYACYQGIKVEQAAGFAARIQGQEKVAGGTNLTNINQANGSDVTGDPDPSLVAGVFAGQPTQAPPSSVYGKIYKLVKEMFPANVRDTQVFVPLPLQGQNFDKVTVVRIINVPKIPFMNWGSLSQIKLAGHAWGGEDTYMYGLPRWFDTSGNSGGKPTWQTLIQQSNSSNNNP